MLGASEYREAARVFLGECCVEAFSIMWHVAGIFTGHILSHGLSSVRAVGTMSSIRAVGFGFHSKLANQQQTTISNHNKVTSSSSAHIGKGDGCESQHVAQYIAVGASSQGGLFCCL